MVTWCKQVTQYVNNNGGGVNELMTYYVDKVGGDLIMADSMAPIIILNERHFKFVLI